MPAHEDGLPGGPPGPRHHGCAGRRAAGGSGRGPVRWRSPRRSSRDGAPGPAGTSTARSSRRGAASGAPKPRCSSTPGRTTVGGRRGRTRHTERPPLPLRTTAGQPAGTRQGTGAEPGVVPAAVNDEEGSATISADAPGPGRGIRHRHRDSCFDDMTAHQEKVPVTTTRAPPRGEQPPRVPGDAGVRRAAHARRRETGGVRRRVGSGRVPRGIRCAPRHWCRGVKRRATTPTLRRWPRISAAATVR